VSDHKRDYVRREMKGKHGGHHCHWPGCGKACPPACWGCYFHWMKLPRYLRDKVWSAFRPGQEVSKTPSAEYVAVAREVRQWIKENYPDAEEDG
jgi:hypothetical protein